MKTHSDEAVAEVRAARKSLCDRFGNDPRHLRAEQLHYRGRIIKNWAELKLATALARNTDPK